MNRRLKEDSRGYGKSHPFSGQLMLNALTCGPGSSVKHLNGSFILLMAYRVRASKNKDRDSGENVFTNSKRVFFDRFRGWVPCVLLPSLLLFFLYVSSGSSPFSLLS